MADLSPFRTVVDLQAITDVWWLDYKWLRLWALRSGQDFAWVREAHDEWQATYGPFSPPWVVAWSQEGSVWRASVSVWLSGSMRIDEPADWTPEPLDDTGYYRQHFEGLGQVTFRYPEPEESRDVTVPGAEIPDFASFAITAVERRQA